MNEASIYQRTDNGRQEIRSKSHGLTQSERMVLLTVDGIASYRELCGKLTSLTPQRLERALQKLEQLCLAMEILLPEAEPVEDAFEPEVIDLFLRQDALDPVTMICFDEEEAEELLEVAAAPSAPAPAPAPTTVDLESWVAEPLAVETVQVPAMAEEEAPAIAPEPIQVDVASAMPLPLPISAPAPVPSSSGWSRGWEFWSIAIGLALIAVSIAGRYIA